jgi:hypothetical protein
MPVTPPTMRESINKMVWGVTEKRASRYLRGEVGLASPGGKADRTVDFNVGDGIRGLFLR